MIKCLLYIIFIISLEYVILQSNSCVGSGLSAEDCSKKLNENEKNEGSYCCFFSGTRKDNNYEDKQCITLSEDEFENIDRNVDEKKETHTNPSIDCNSYYLHISIIILLFLL